MVAAFLLAGASPASAETTEIEREFDSLSSLRISQSVSVAGASLEARFYTGYEPERVTIANETGSTIRFSSYAGYLAKVMPGDVFDVPCDGQAIAGELDIVQQATVSAVDEQALCGDLILVREKEDA